MASRRNSALKHIFRVWQLLNRNLLGELHDFPTIPPCSTKVYVLETGDVPILFSLSQMKNLGMTIELDQKKETTLHVQLGVCILLQLSTPQWDTLCWTWRVLRISQRPSRERCDVELPWVGDCKTNVGDISHSSPRVFNPRLRCRPDARFVDLFTDEMVDFVWVWIQVAQKSTNTMRSFCVSSVFTMMWVTRIALVRIVSKTKQTTTTWGFYLGLHLGRSGGRGGEEVKRWRGQMEDAKQRSRQSSW